MLNFLLQGVKDMAEIFNNKINFLKALAILIVVSGHLEFSLIPMFPPYSFQVILFFFIAGMLFKEKYGFFELVKKRIKTLIIPYFLYEIFYIGITFLIAPIVGKFWGMRVNLYNELIMPFLTGHQLDLISPLWFVPCLFITLILYKLFSYIKFCDGVRFFFYLILCFLAANLDKFSDNIFYLPFIRSFFALFFVHLGFIYKNKIEDKINIFTPKILYSILILQSILWLFNKDFSPLDGIGLHYLLVWGKFFNPFVSILTSLTGIYIVLFIIEVIYPYLKNWNFIHKIGQNTYHIMANHLLIFNILTYSFLYIKGIPFDVKNSSDIYWFYFPLKTTYFYFVVGVISTVYFGEFLKFLKRKIFAVKEFTK